MLMESNEQFRRARLISALEAVCEHLELTSTQREEARTRYDGVSRWLAESSHPALAGVTIYVQGSTAIGTTVKPIGRDEHDVDLIARLQAAARGFPPAVVKKIIGDRLREHGVYDRLLKEMCRCWRLDYANEFHLDITPSIPNPACVNDGELVPDRELRHWKASNPRGYKAAFDRRAALRPRMRLLRSLQLDKRAAASIEPYPEAGGFKGVLRRTVQIAKRHRDVHFARRPDECAPISVIVTTLLAWSYENCVAHMEFEDELDVLTATVAGMADFIEHRDDHWFIWNDTTPGENFAEKWNSHPDRAASFFSWHRKLVADIAALRTVEGLDRIGRQLDEALGGRPAQIAIAHLEKAVSAPRAAGALRYGAAGLAAGGPALAAPRTSAAVPRNTFFGA
jgi:hypothetical protein